MGFLSPELGERGLRERDKLGVQSLQTSGIGRGGNTKTEPIRVGKKKKIKKEREREMERGSSQQEGRDNRAVYFGPF